MGNYTNMTLSQGETVIADAELDPTLYILAFAPFMAVGILIVASLICREIDEDDWVILIGCVINMIIWLLLLSNEITLTDQRLVTKSGFYLRKHLSCNFPKLSPFHAI